MTTLPPLLRHRAGLAWMLAVLLAGFSVQARAQTSEALFAATLKGLQGEAVALKRWQGQPLIINFWARWCSPCREEIPDLVDLRQRKLSSGLEVLGIAIEDKPGPVSEFAKAYEIDYPVLLAPREGLPIMKALGNARMGLPFTVAVDRHGQVVRVKMGRISRIELEDAAVAALR